MNHYFTPRTPEPRPGALGVVLRSMMCAIVVVAVGAGIWLGFAALRQDSVPDEWTRDGWNEASTNDIEQVATRSP